MRIAVFASGTGSNYRAIAEAAANGRLPQVELALVLSDRQDAPVLDKAAADGVLHRFVDPKGYETKADYETKLLRILEEQRIDLIVLAGYMRIIGPTLLHVYRGSIINIHPSLLPSFPGKSGIADAFDYGVKITGATVHYVDDGIDTGPIIAQEMIRITANDTLATVTEKIHQIEHQLYPAVLAELTEKG
ncbi:phosphoribosylglycinamide formyltransferase [Enterococcus sp. 8G7_MSG3316]|uniref:Phosphoribosylglycinamide formyltransferase n=1 Tax=Candidatus Enterococcus testudinis TaxID=1834191 RepID=A0A242A7H5_9ENTE|nr:phosphoribosylglycinamide formyltransferase [Enterococcus sp. 8G7_MSG3316]OTN76681.1 phosphoribosylglycinamide formyltransferase [Enterococcus sp. 8G7_MSG3316]